MEKIQLKRRQVTRCSPQSQLLEGKQQNEMGSNKAPIISLTERCTYAGAGVNCSPREDSKGVQRAFSLCLLPSPSLGVGTSLAHGPTPLPVSYHLAQGKLIPDLDATYYSRLAKSEHGMPLISVTDAL